MKKLIFLFMALFLIASINACSSASEHSRGLKSKENKMSLGVIQKEIKKGMTQTDVTVALGAPNVVTKDAEGKETWVYDRIARTVSYSGSGLNTVLLLGVYENRKSAKDVSETTLTVVIKFDENHLVESFSYHSSKF